MSSIKLFLGCILAGAVVATTAKAQVVVYSPPVTALAPATVPVTSYYAPLYPTVTANYPTTTSYSLTTPIAPVTTYRPYSAYYSGVNGTPTSGYVVPYTAGPARTSYRPVVVGGAAVSYPYVSPTYVPGQPVRNALRSLAW